MPRRAYPLVVGDAGAVAQQATRCRFGGAPWISPVVGTPITSARPAAGNSSDGRPCAADGKPLALLIQLAADELPAPLALDHALVQIFGVTGRKGCGMSDLCGRIVDCDPANGWLARAMLPEDATCRAVSFSTAVLDPVNHQDPHRGTQTVDRFVRPLAQDKLFGNPLATPEPWAAELGVCADCAQPFELLLHIEGKLHVPYSFGDAGWVVVGYCPAHPLRMAVTQLQVP